MVAKWTFMIVLGHLLFAPFIAGQEVSAGIDDWVARSMQPFEAHGVWQFGLFFHR